MSSGELLLRRWHEIKLQIRALEQEEESIKAKIKAAMEARGLKSMRSQNYMVTKTDTSRESLGKKDCPANVWAQCAKKTSYSIFRVTKLGEAEIGDSEQ